MTMGDLRGGDSTYPSSPIADPSYQRLPRNLRLIHTPLYVMYASMRLDSCGFDVHALALSVRLSPCCASSVSMAHLQTLVQ